MGVAAFVSVGAGSLRTDRNINDKPPERKVIHYSLHDGQRKVLAAIFTTLFFADGLKKKKKQQHNQQLIPGRGSQHGTRRAERASE